MFLPYLHRLITGGIIFPLYKCRNLFKSLGQGTRDVSFYRECISTQRDTRGKFPERRYESHFLFMTLVNRQLKTNKKCWVYKFSDSDKGFLYNMELVLFWGLGELRVNTWVLEIRKQRLASHKHSVRCLSISAVKTRFLITTSFKLSFFHTSQKSQQKTAKLRCWCFCSKQGKFTLAIYVLLVRILLCWRQSKQTFFNSR